jgi:LemA protein
MNHEKELLTEITKIRTEAKKAISPAQAFAQSNALTSLLGQLFISVENYPDLKSSANFLELQAQLERAEEDIAAARRAYNASVQTYNNSTQMFPQSIVAALFRFKKSDMFEAGDTTMDFKKLLNRTDEKSE